MEEAQTPTSVTMFQTPDGEWDVLPDNIIQPFATRIVVVSRILSVSEVKSLARNIQTLNGAGAQARSIITSAARQGKRVRMTITDYKEYHTSYSTQIKYAIIP